MISDAELRRLVRESLGPEDLARSKVHRYRAPLREGEHLLIGPRSLPVPFDAILVVVDLAPDYNWAHPCQLVLVREHGGAMQVYPSSFPPGGRGWPQGFPLILQYGVDVLRDDAPGERAALARQGGT